VQVLQDRADCGLVVLEGIEHTFLHRCQILLKVGFWFESCANRNQIHTMSYKAVLAGHGLPRHTQADDKIGLAGESMEQCLERGHEQHDHGRPLLSGGPLEGLMNRGIQPAFRCGGSCRPDRRTTVIGWKIQSRRQFDKLPAPILQRLSSFRTVPLSDRRILFKAFRLFQVGLFALLQRGVDPGELANDQPAGPAVTHHVMGGPNHDMVFGRHSGDAHPQ
jgi:hypothetical protein